MIRVPHSSTVIAFCVAAVAGYAALTAWVVLVSADPGLRGDVIGTWKSFAVAAFAFWVGSSSGGKVRDIETPTASGKTDDPVHVVKDDTLDLTGAEAP